MCDSLVIPLVTIVTFAWTIYQEYRHHTTKTVKVKVK